MRSGNREKRLDTGMGKDTWGVKISDGAALPGFAGRFLKSLDRRYRTRGGFSRMAASLRQRGRTSWSPLRSPC